MDIKNRKFLKVAVAVVVTIVGLVTGILAIVGLAGKGSVKPETAMCYSLGAAFVTIGLASVIIGLSKENIEKNAVDYISGAICISIAILLFVQGSEVVEIIITGFVPLTIAAFGGVFFLKSVVALIKKENVGKCVVILILSVIALVAGILLYSYRTEPKLKNIEWLLIGIAIFAIGIAYLVSVIKNKKFSPLKKEQQ